MARLAAYYQEDFQYPLLGPKNKQRKSAYIFYEEPKNNLFNEYVLNGDRLRSLASSEPALSPLSHLYKPEKMTLKHKPIVYGSQLIENSHPSMQYFDNNHSVPTTNNRFSRLQTEFYDNDSRYVDNRAFYDDRYIPRYQPGSRDKSHKRFSYIEPRNNGHSPEIYLTQNYDQYHPHRQMEPDFNVYDNRYHNLPKDYLYESSQGSLSPRSPVYYHNGSNTMHYQQWPSEEVLPNQGLLSPPSPLDSGLSSQSITSSPSLEAESFPSYNESVAAGRSDREHICSCSNVQFTDTRCHSSNLSRHDSGRSSGAYSSYRYPKESLRLKNGLKKSSHTRNDLNHNGYQSNQVRYGKLGLLGEPIQTSQNINTSKKKHENLYRKENRTLESMCEASFEAENEVVLSRKSPPRTSKPYNQHSNYEKPFVVITEPSEKSTESEDQTSLERDRSPKSEDLESSSSATVSNSVSKSSSAASSNNDLRYNRKPNRTTEKEIRELEDMYKKCNLSDVDLLDRAERRDLPTAHQTKRYQTNSTLKRSKSDTLYETIDPIFRNPYEIPQRAPPYRRSGLPDRVADDMALRKLRKSVTAASCNGAKNTITYMLCNSHFTPTVPACNDFLLIDYPDVEFDDLSYRKHYFGKKSKVPDPQPPFGIPLRPPPPQKVFTDYLHVIPSDCPQPLCHPKGNPDVVRDDLAFRALRKDEPERIYYDMSHIYNIRKS